MSKLVEWAKKDHKFIEQLVFLYIVITVLFTANDMAAESFRSLGDLALPAVISIAMMAACFIGVPRILMLFYPSKIGEIHLFLIFAIVAGSIF